MNRQQVIQAYKQFLKCFALCPQDLILIGGAACVMHGIRDETADVDLDASRAVYRQVLGFKEIRLKDYGPRFPGDTDWVMVEWQGYDLGCQTPQSLRPENWVEVDGVRFQSLSQLLAQKQTWNRPKDQEDIRRLKALISQASLGLG